MPTGYTYPVQTGEIADLRAFALRCARGMGACVMQRDDSMDQPPKLQEPSDYNLRKKKEAEDELMRLRSLSFGEILTEHREKLDDARMRAENYKMEKDLERQRYEAMIAKVEKWPPPSPDHNGLKDLMLSQLRESIDFDCGIHTPSVNVSSDANQWFGEAVKKAERDVEYHREQHQKERERCDEQNRWIRKLYESLPTEPETDD